MEILEYAMESIGKAAQCLPGDGGEGKRNYKETPETLDIYVHYLESGDHCVAAYMCQMYQTCNLLYVSFASKRLFFVCVCLIFIWQVKIKSGKIKSQERNLSWRQNNHFIAHTYTMGVDKCRGGQGKQNPLFSNIGRYAKGESHKEGREHTAIKVSVFLRLLYGFLLYFSNQTTHGRGFRQALQTSFLT